MRSIFKLIFANILALAVALVPALAPQVALAQSAADIAVQQAKVQRDADIAQKKAEAEAASARAALQNQQQAQMDAANKSKQGGDMASLLGMGLMGAGAVMVAVGMAQPPPTGPNMALVAAGMFMIAGGVGSMMAGQKMDNNSNRGYQNAGNLGSIGTPDGLRTNTGTILNKDGSLGDRAGGGKLEIDTNALRNGKLGEIFDKFEAETGINRDDFAKGVASGLSPAELLQGQGGLTKEQYQNGIDNALASGGKGSPLDGADIEKLAKDAGLDELYAAANDGTVDFDGSGASRALAAKGGAGSESKFDFGKLGGAETAAAGADKVDISQLSEQVQKQLAKEGRTGLTLFQIVSSRYRKVTPMMFGEDTGLSGTGAAGKNVFLDEI